MKFTGKASERISFSLPKKRLAFLSSYFIFDSDLNNNKIDAMNHLTYIYQRTLKYYADYEAYVCFKATVNYAQIMSCLICFTMKYNFLGV